MVLASGDGTWDGNIVNAHNPQRRDVQILPANGYIVCLRSIRVKRDTADWHSSGASMAIRQRRCLALSLPHRVARRWGAVCNYSRTAGCYQAAEHSIQFLPELQELGDLYSE